MLDRRFELHRRTGLEGEHLGSQGRRAVAPGEHDIQGRRQRLYALRRVIAVDQRLAARRGPESLTISGQLFEAHVLKRRDQRRLVVLFAVDRAAQVIHQLRTGAAGDRVLQRQDHFTANALEAGGVEGPLANVRKQLAQQQQLLVVIAVDTQGETLRVVIKTETQPRQQGRIGALVGGIRDHARVQRSRRALLCRGAGQRRAKAHVKRAPGHAKLLGLTVPDTFARLLQAQLRLRPVVWCDGQHSHILGDKGIGRRQVQSGALPGLPAAQHDLLRAETREGHRVKGAHPIGADFGRRQHHLGPIRGQQGQGVGDEFGVETGHQVRSLKNIFIGVVVHAITQTADVVDRTGGFAKAKRQPGQRRLFGVEPLAGPGLAQHVEIGEHLL